MAKKNKDTEKKPDTKGKGKAEEKDEEKSSAEFKFGVDDIAEELDIKPASVRVKLRNAGIEKQGKSYGWNTKSELKEVIAQLKASDDDEDEKPAKKSKAKDDDEDEKPAKKSKAKDDEAPAAKKSKGKAKKDEDADDEKPAKKSKAKKSKTKDEDDD